MDTVIAAAARQNRMVLLSKSYPSRRQPVIDSPDHAEAATQS